MDPGTLFLRALALGDVAAVREQAFLAMQDERDLGELILAARKMKFDVSEGMVLAASPEGPGIFLVSADAGAEPGMRVK